VTATDYNGRAREQFIQYIIYVFQTYQDYSGSYPLQTVSFNINNINSGNSIQSDINIQVRKILSESDYEITFVDPAAENTGGWGIQNSWFNYLKIPYPTYQLSEFSVTGKPFASISGSGHVSGYEAEFEFNQYFTLEAIGDGVYYDGSTNNITIKINAGTYTRTEVLDIINAQFKNYPETSNFIFDVEIDNVTNEQYVVCRTNINKTYTAKDYKLVYYDKESFIECIPGQSVKTTAWNSTLGYMLGFTTQTEYLLNTEIEGSITYLDNDVVRIISESVVSTYIYRNFMIILEDYNQSRMNDGLITSTPQKNVINIPGGFYKNPKYICDPITKIPIYQGETIEPATKTYSENRKLESNIVVNKYLDNGPYIKDIFATIPLNPDKTTLVEFGGTLQNQERVYFGPVNIRRLSIKLQNDRGELVDLNGSNWSFGFVCEQLYSPNNQ
jgi:hypothetical protein